MNELTHLSLFSGVGGLDLAAEMAGFETVGQCEWADFPTRVLEKHWPDIPRWRDVRELNKQSFAERTKLRSATVLSGGFPCQPFSIAGKQKGVLDDRYLWPEMLRVASELRPHWIIGENVENAVRLVLDDIIDSLEGIGYIAQAFVVSAYCTGSWFDGKRTFIVASANDRGSAMRWDAQLQTDASAGGCRSDHRGRAEITDTGKWWSLESRPYGVVNELPHRMDRLKCLGNAVVPSQAYPFFKAIADIERKELGEKE